MTVHTILSPSLTAVADDVLRERGVGHVAHGDADHVRAAVAVTADPKARAIIGPFRSRAVAEVVELTAPTRLPLLAPVATWVGVTRSDEPGCDDHPARHNGTVFRLVARDTVVAHAIASRLAAEARPAYVIAGAHEYGVQLDSQLGYVGLGRVDDPEDADVIVLAGLRGGPENDRARELAPLPVIAFDGIQGERFPDQVVEVALVYAPGPLGAAETRRAAELLSVTTDPDELRRIGPFDENGDPLRPLVRYAQMDEPHALG